MWLVALAWRVIELGGGPTELSLVTALFSVGLLTFVLIGGVAADLIRAAVLLVLGLLSLSGDLGIWHLAVGGSLIGAGEALFISSYTALLPHLLPEDELLTTKGLTRTMKITDADHTNWRVKDVERSLGFYRDVLGLEPFGLEEYRRGEHPLVSLRVTPGFILHLRPDPTFEPVSTGGYDHLALVVEGANVDALAEHLTHAGVEIERISENVIGARGSGKALYVRDPDGYLIELKLYTDE